MKFWKFLVVGVALANQALAAPAQSGEDWPVTDLRTAQIAPAALQQVAGKIRDQSWPGITSVLVVRRGALAHEAYFNSGGVDKLNDMRSASKTLTAMLLGVAIERGLVEGVAAPVYGFFAERKLGANADPRHLKITLEDLLTMSSLWECNDDNPWSAGNEERMYVTEDWLGFALDLPIKGFAPWMPKPQDSPHGRAFSYCTAGSFVLGAVIEKASGQSLAAFAQAHLEQPLGIREVTWNRSPLGIGIGGGGTRYRSRDIARFGELLLRGGRWHGHQVLPARWVQEMLTVRVQARENADYGYQIWRMPFAVGDRQYPSWAMSGNGGNYVFIQPELELVVVITSSAYNQREAHPNSQALYQLILDGVRDGS